MLFRSVPAFDIAEVGAGGGSIAWIDEGGALRVGPESAGAEPGPAAYGRGGTRPTITDANVVLGYMNPIAIAGGTVPIDHAGAHAALATIADPLELPAEAAAYGVHQVGNATMARAIRAVTTERGRDPREFDLVAFGGSGAIHAMTLAESLGIDRVCVPLHPGLFSALGLMLADLRYDYVQSVPGELDEAGVAGLETAFARLETQAFADAGRDPSEAGLTVHRSVDLRYAGQSSDLTLPLEEADSARWVTALTRHFHEEHERTYGYSRPADTVNVVSVRLRLLAPAKSLDRKSTRLNSSHSSVSRMPSSA